MATTTKVNVNYSSQFYFSAEEELDLFEEAGTTPPKTDISKIASQALLQTPSPVKKTEKMLKKTTPDRSAVKKEKRIFSKLGEVLDREEEKFPFKKFKRRLFDSVTQDFLPRVNAFSVSSADRHFISVNNVEDCFSECWIEDLLRTLKKAGLNIAVVNTGHITEPQVTHKTTGFHFCPTGHPHENCLIQTYQSSYSEVWYGEFNAGKGVKKSSFFPRSIQTERQLLEIIADAEKLCVGKNRALFKTNTTNLFYFEIFYRDIYIISAFPIYYFAPYSEGATIHLTPSLSVPMKDIANQLSKLTRFEREDLVRYSLNEGGCAYTILDVASLIKDNPIDQGVYIQFPIKEIESKPS